MAEPLPEYDPDERDGPSLARDEAPTALVTGGSRGIGRAVVERLAADGYRVVAVGRDETALRDVADHAEAAGQAVEIATADVTDESAVRDLFDTYGPVDVLVANAGVSSSAPLHRTSLADWQAQLDVNATGVFLCVREALGGMRSAGRGRIVVVASTAGLRGAPYIAAYTASKHAAVGLTRAAAAEVAGTGITVNAVCPGYVDTPMTDRNVARIEQLTGRSEREARDAIVASSKLGRLVSADEVAAAVAYLVGDDAAPVNGQTLVLDGGGVQS